MQICYQLELWEQPSVNCESKWNYFPPRKCIWMCRLWNGADFVYVSMHYAYQFICHIATHYSDVIMSAMASQINSVPIVCSTVCSGADQRKHQSSASLAFVRVIHRWSVDSPDKGPITRKMFPFDNVIMSWEHAMENTLTSIPHARVSLGAIYWGTDHMVRV